MDRQAALRRDAPSARGVDAAGIAAFLDAAAEHELHGLMIWRDGAVVAEGHWAPYAAHRPHMLHSAVKSWTGTAVGLLLGDGALRLDDRVLSFFPDHRPAAVSAHLDAMTVRDLLTMRSGHRTGMSGGAWRGTRGSWIADFLARPVEDPPGESFIYSSGSSYALSAIVSRVCGERVDTLLTRRVLGPIGAGAPAWDVSPEGYSTGGNGLSCTLEDMLRFGVLHLQDGVWEGQRLLPEGWVAEATRNQVREAWIAATDGRTYAGRGAADAEVKEGYGYHWWMTAEGGYRASGMFGQQVIVLPRHRAVVAITAGLDRTRPPLQPILFRHLVPALDRAGDGAADRALAARLDALALGWPGGTADGPDAAAIDGRAFAMDPNEDGVTRIAFTRDDQVLRFRMEDGRGLHEVACGLHDPVESDTTVTGATLHHQYEPGRMRVVARAAWTAPGRLEMTWRFVETAFCDTVVATVTPDGLRLERRVNTNAGPLERPPITGRAT